MFNDDGQEDAMETGREQVIAAVRKATQDGRLSCAAAHDIAEALGVALAEIGTVCNELKIKITNCQLGCF